MKKILILLLVAIVLPACVPVNAAFYTDKQLADLEQRMTDKCNDILEAVNHPEYFDGGCAEWVNDQLNYNGVGYWYEGKYSHGYGNGNLWFDGLDEGAVTETGYLQVKYPGETAIYDLVADFGSYPIFNVVLSLEKGNGKWADSGHVLYIWCIYNGYVYYSDTFNQTFGEAGTLVKRPLDQFVQLYDMISGPILGAVHFEGDEVASFHPGEKMSAQYSVLGQSSLRSSPVEQIGGEDTTVETLDAGAPVSVCGAYTDVYGQRWLKVDGGRWIKETDVTKNGNYSTISCEGLTVPQLWLCQHGFTLEGSVTSNAGPFTYITATITDAEGNIVAGGEQAAGDTVFDLSVIDQATRFEQLAAGMYRYRIEVANSVQRLVVVDAEFEMRAYGRYRDETYYEHTETDRVFAPCDTDFNGTVDTADIMKVYMGSTRGDGGYLCDVNGDGHVNLTDMYLINAQIEKDPV